MGQGAGAIFVGSSITGTAADLDATAAIIGAHRIGTTTIGGSMLVGIDLSTSGEFSGWQIGSSKFLDHTAPLRSRRGFAKRPCPPCLPGE